MPLGGLLPYPPGQQPQMGAMQPGTQQQGAQKSGSKGGAGKFDMTQTVLQQPLQLLSQIISRQMMEASQMGVPYDALLGQLMQTAQQMGQGAGMALAGGGGQGPNGPQGPGGGPPPPGGPQPPQPGQQDQTQQGAYQQLNPGQQQTPSMQAPGAINQALTGQAPQAPQQPGNFLYQPGNAAMGQGPSMLGGFITQTPADQALFANAAQTRQAIRGETPLQAKDKQELEIARVKAQADGASKLVEFGKWVGDRFTKQTDQYSTQFQAYANMQELAKLPSDGANDLAFAYEFVKFSDPNRVTEGERQDVANAIPLLQRYTGVKLKEWFIGGNLTMEAKRAIMKAGTAKYTSLKRGYDAHVNRASTQLSRQGIDARDFIVDSSIPLSQQKQRGAQQANGNKIGKYTYS